MNSGKKRISAGVISIEDSKRLDADEVSKINLSLLDLESELAERQAALNILKKMQLAGGEGGRRTPAPTRPPKPLPKPVIAFGH